MDDVHAAALERWLVREATQRALGPFLRGDEPFDPLAAAPNAGSAPPREISTSLFSLLLSFPPFQRDPKAREALVDVVNRFPAIDARLRSAPGSRGLKAVIAPILSGPILSAARASRPGVAAGAMTSAEIAAALLKEISAERDGLERFMEELKSVHHFSELRPSAKAWVESARGAILQWLLQAASHPSQQVKLRRILSLVPKKTILMMLKTHSTSGAIGTGISVLFARTMGSKSILQRIVIDWLDHDRITEELERALVTLSADRARILAEFAEEHVSTSDVMNDSGLLDQRKVALASYLMLASDGADRFVDDADALRGLRVVDLMRTRRSNEELIALLEDDRMIESLTRLATCTHGIISRSVLAKGSGLVRLAEDCFWLLESVASITNAAEDVQTITPSKTSTAQNPLKGKSDNASSNLSRIVDSVINRVLALVHNVLVGDVDFVVHDIIRWYFKTFEAALCHPFDLNRLVSSLQSKSTSSSPGGDCDNLTSSLPVGKDDHLLSILSSSKQEEVASSYEQILEEAKRAHDRECANRAMSGPWQPRPVLPVSERLLLPLVTEHIRETLDAMLQLATEDATCQRSSSVPSESSGPLRASKADGVHHIEVLFDHAEVVTWGALSSRKFVLCGRLWTSSLWIRHRSDVPFKCGGGGGGVDPLSSPPVVEITFSNSDRSPLVVFKDNIADSNGESDGDASLETDWILVPKNLNKGAVFGGKLFLWFRRARNEAEVSSGRVLGLEVLPVNSDQRKKEALSMCGYRRVFVLGTGILHRSEVWMCGGVNRAIDLGQDG